jgi:hypothetical protein
LLLLLLLIVRLLGRGTVAWHPGTGAARRVRLLEVVHLAWHRDLGLLSNICRLKNIELNETFVAFEIKYSRFKERSYHSTDNNFMSALIDKIYFNVKIQMIFELAMKYCY